MGPIRELGFAALKTVRAEDVRPLAVKVICRLLWVFVCLFFYFAFFAIFAANCVGAHIVFDPFLFAGFRCSVNSNTTKCFARELTSLFQVVRAVWCAEIIKNRILFRIMNEPIVECLL